MASSILSAIFARFSALLAGQFLTIFLQKKIRRGVLKAAHAYIEAVRIARLAVLGIFGIGVFAALLVSGFFTAVFGVLALMPLEARTVAKIAVGAGLVLSIGSGVALIIIFSQKRWLKASRAYEVMEAATSPWLGSLPPKPREIFNSGGDSLPSESFTPERREAGESGRISTSILERRL